MNIIDPPEIIGVSPAWLESLERVSDAAPIDRPLLVVGERGSGKELIAERLHFLSRRWDGPYVKVNCAALSEELLDSELFGHEPGSFTGAARRRIGRFEQADKGTLFLDEIATASLPVQEKLLRVIEYGEFQRLGGEEVLHCDVRVIGATNVDLPAKAEKGEFRADLLDRLAFDVITLPPLRAREEDIAILAEYFGTRMAREMGVFFPGFTRSAMTLLETHDWPGNVRELKNAVERAFYREIANRTEDLMDRPINLPNNALDPFVSAYRPGAELTKKAPADPQGDLKSKPVIPLPDAPRSDQHIEFELLTSRYERQLVDAALAATDGHQKRAAAYLGLSYNQLRNLLRKYGYQRNAPRRDDEEEETPAAGEG